MHGEFLYLWNIWVYVFFACLPTLARRCTSNVFNIITLFFVDGWPWCTVYIIFNGINLRDIFIHFCRYHFQRCKNSEQSHSPKFNVRSVVHFIRSLKIHHLITQLEINGTDNSSHLAPERGSAPFWLVHTWCRVIGEPQRIPCPMKSLFVYFISSSHLPCIQHIYLCHKL